MSFERYAIYYSPSPGSRLAEFGEQWLGRDGYGQSIDREKPYEGRELQELSRAPAHYGFHATLKAPFRLVQDHPRRLKDALELFARTQTKITVPALKLTQIGDFLALCPGGVAGPNAELDALAAQCVRKFDRFRAPLSEEERTRRNPDRLSFDQQQNLERWGYPFVFDEYRFHMTLTGLLSNEERNRVLDLLNPFVEELGSEPFTLDSICIFGDPGQGKPFRLLERYRLPKQI